MAKKAGHAFALACALATVAAGSTAVAGSSTLALVGGTVVDLDERGRRARDVDDGVVLVEGGRVRAAGRRGEIEIPADARTIDVRGRFVVPGLIDGFAGMNSGAQARAYLHAGVTTIVGVADRRRGALALEVTPRPRVLPLEAVGYGGDGEPSVAPEAVRRQIDALAATGVRVLLLMYPLPPESVAAAVLRASELGLATIGELGETPYPAALDLGVQAFVHTSRYSLALAPEATRRAVAQQPFGPPKLAYYEALVATLAEGPGADAFPATLAAALLSLETRYAAAGARYLAGSGTSAFGTMPGISLRHELELLVRVGLTPRQALAAATENFREAFGWRDLGCLAAGCAADLLVLRRDPTVDLAALREIELLIVGGELVDGAALLAP